MRVGHYLDDGGHPLIIWTIGFIINLVMSLFYEPVHRGLNIVVFILGAYLMSRHELSPEANANVPPIPWLAILHSVFWSLVLLYELGVTEGAELRARMVHNRLHENQGALSCMWVLLSFVAGITPGSARMKFACVGFSSLVILARLWILAQAWESANGSRRGADLLTAVFEAEPAEPRLAVELLRSGTYVLVCVTALSLALGVYSRAKWEAVVVASKLSAVMELSAVLELRAQNVSLEEARRNALIREQQLARRGSGGAASSLRSRRPFSAPSGGQLSDSFTIAEGVEEQDLG